VIRDKLKSIKEVEVDPPLEVLVKELAASTVNLEVRFWVDSCRAGFLQATSRVTQGIKEALQAAKIEMPTDIYTIAIRNMPRIAIKLETQTRNSHSSSD
jgi:small conductance mechanosensitive channel